MSKDNFSGLIFVNQSYLLWLANKSFLCESRMSLNSNQSIFPSLFVGYQKIALGTRLAFSIKTWGSHSLIKHKGRVPSLNARVADIAFPHWTQRSRYSFQRNSAFSAKSEGHVPSLNVSFARAPHFNFKRELCVKCEIRVFVVINNNKNGSITLTLPT